MKNNVYMNVYDLICIESMPNELKSRLNFSGVLTSQEVILSEKIPNTNKKYVFLSNNENDIKKALRDELCIGISFKDNFVIKKTLEQISDHEKLVFVSASTLTLAKKNELPKILHKVRSVLKYSHIFNADIAVVTFANEPWKLLSAAQLYRVAQFIYDDERIAKKTVSSLERFFE